MKPLRETLKELGINCTSPIEIQDANGEAAYFKNSEGHWSRCECDSNGNVTYDENSKGEKRGTPTS